MTLIERWENQENQQRYIAWRGTLTGDPRLSEAYTAPTTFTWYSEEPQV